MIGADNISHPATRNKAKAAEVWRPRGASLNLMVDLWSERHPLLRPLVAANNIQKPLCVHAKITFQPHCETWSQNIKKLECVSLFSTLQFFLSFMANCKIQQVQHSGMKLHQWYWRKQVHRYLHFVSLIQPFAKQHGQKLSEENCILFRDLISIFKKKRSLEKFKNTWLRCCS